MSRYTDRYRTPSPLFPQQSPTTLEKLLGSWELLRELDIHGYRTSAATPASTWLVKIAWADGHTCGRSQGRGTTCSPFVTQAAAIAYSKTDSEPYEPVLSDGRPLPNLFSHAANGALRANNRCHQKAMEAIGLTMADNEWPRPIIFFNMGYAVEPEQMRRGDAVHIDWMNGGGHAVYCWDVHLNDRGEVDAFCYVSSNGSMANGGGGGGVSVGGTSKGAGGFIGSKKSKDSDDVTLYFANKKPLFVDDEQYVVEGAWVTWDDTVAGKILTDMRARPSSRVKKAKRIKVARFHGIDVAKIPLFAMGQDAPAPFTPKPVDEDSVPEINTPRLDTYDDVAGLQRRLKLLFLVGWIKADPGKIDGKAGRKTAAALVAFQRANALKADGSPNTLTMTKLEGVFRSAFDDPKAKKWLDPQKGGLIFAEDSWEDSAELYFRHGVARAGDSLDLILSGEGLPQRAFDVTLVDMDTQDALKTDTYTLTPLGDHAAVTVTLPKKAVGRRLIARLGSSSLESGAPLFVLPAAESST